MPVEIGLEGVRFRSGIPSGNGGSSRAVDVVAAGTRLLQDAGTHICAMLPAPPSTVAEWIAGDPAVATAVARGVTVRLLHAGSHRAARMRSAAQRGTGVHHRVVDEVRHPLVVVDGRVALLSPGGLAHDGLLIAEPLVVAVLAAVFEQLWHEAEPAVSGAGAPAGCSERERAVLRLLRSGVADAVAARLIGVSLRTYHRTVADLLARLDAATRFQAGALAVERGWFRDRRGRGRMSGSRSWEDEGRRGG